MIVLPVLGLAVAVIFIALRRRRRETLSGLKAEHPVFSIDPPEKRLHRASRTRL